LRLPLATFAFEAFDAIFVDLVGQEGGKW
jgi:hypothetical protein